MISGIILPKYTEDALYGIMKRDYFILHDGEDENKEHIIPRIDIITCFAVLLSIYLFVLFIPRPILGLADNGDFFRTIDNTGMYYIDSNYEDRHFGYYNRLYGIRKYAYEPNYIYFSSTALLIEIAKTADTMITGDNIFDLRYLAILYSIIFVYSYYRILRFLSKNLNVPAIILAGLFFIIFADIGYVLYFNSFYGEGASYVFLFLMIAFSAMLSETNGQNIKYLLLFVLSSLLFAASKQQHYLLGIMAGLMCLRLLFLKKNANWRILCTASSVLVISLSIWLFSTVSDDIDHINQYFSVTRGVLLESENPEEDIIQIGMDEKFALLTRTSYYGRYHLELPESDLMKEEFYTHISYLSLVRYYLSNPSRLHNKLDLAVRYSYIIKPVSLGNYEKDAGHSYGEESNFFSLWSKTKQIIFPKSVKFAVLFYLSYFILLLLMYIKKIKSGKPNQKFVIEMMGAVSLIGMAQIAISFIGAGDNDLAKHLFLYNVCFDIMFYSLLVIGISLIRTRLIGKRKGGA